MNSSLAIQETLYSRGPTLEEGKAPTPVQGPLKFQGPQLATKTVEIVCSHNAKTHVPPGSIVKPSQCVSRPVIQSVTQCTQNVIAGMGINPLGMQKMPAGQLYHFHKNWEVLTKDRWILDSEGYQIHILSETTQPWRPHTPKFNLSQTRLIQQEVEEL